MINEFESFMRDYQNMVYTTALRLVGSEADAQDVAQEVFLKAYQRFPELQGSPTAGGWLKTVATNLSLNHLQRYRSRWRFFSEMADPEDPQDNPADLAVAPDSELLPETDRHELVERALMSLPTAQRVPLVLFHLQGLKYEEIAAQLQVSLGKVKTDIFRGREALRQKLSREYGGELAAGTGGTNP